MVTEVYKLREIIDEPEWSNFLDGDEYRRLVVLRDALQMRAEKQVAQSG